MGQSSPSRRKEHKEILVNFVRDFVNSVLKLLAQCARNLIDKRLTVLRILQAEKIIFSNQNQALGISICHQQEIPSAIEALKLPSPRPVIVWIGGAGSLTAYYVGAVCKVAHTVAQIAQKTNAVIVDGATEAGVMAVMGQVYDREKYRFPLIGVVARQLVDWSNVPQKQQRHLMEKMQLTIKSLLVRSAGDPGNLDPYHTHFFFVPGKRWGAESGWISDIATQISGHCPSVTILSNARPGGICVQDVEYSLHAGRPVLVMQGTGGWADELASRPPRSALWKIVGVNDQQQGILEALLPTNAFAD